ncbi:hypothetical protein PV797_01650 [Clostridiaceae bacterium M8S5]|nr:hypothetical protein PV797_01650 [Clostridiaceae bacterium M8S5]
MDSVKKEAQSCNLRFLNADVTLSVSDNIATVTVGYFIENAGMITVTDVFNTGTITFPKDFVIDNITTNNDLLTITPSEGQILYNGNLGDLVPGETVLITLQFDIIGVNQAGDFIISNISEVVDGQGDDIVFSKNVVLNVVDILTNVKFDKDRFNFSITNNSTREIRVDMMAGIVIPANVEIIFRNLNPFTATFINSTKPVPTNQIIEGLNTVALSIKDVLIQPFSTVILPVSFDLYSSKQIGIQEIIATIDKVSLAGTGNDTVFIRVLPSPENEAKAFVLLELR